MYGADDIARIVHLNYPTWNMPLCRLVSRYSSRVPREALAFAADTFRHQAITWLTKNSGLADAELQLITGHSQRTSLAIYQHVAVDGQLADRYQQAMKDVGL